MTHPSTHERFTLVASGSSNRLGAFARDVRQGLTSSPKHLSCCYFYDAEGSALFEEICELPEYYLTRAEREILEAHADDLVNRFPAAIDLVELGSGSASKTRVLIEAFLRERDSLRYVPVDICRVVLEESSRQLLKDYPGLEIVAVAAEYQEAMSFLQTANSSSKLILWLGSNVGNFDRLDAGRFLLQVKATMSNRDALLIGIDFRKDAAELESAYDDAAGITAAFNLNLLTRINRELGGRFDLDSFKHRAGYNESLGRIEMYLVSRRTQQVRIDNLGLEIELTAGEAIHSENSYKYSFAEIESLAAAAGLQIAEQWLDSQERFSVNLMLPSTPPST
jgi:L-histidine N-alpha-methyltransferase